MHTNLLNFYWPFKLKKGYLVQAQDVLNKTHYAIIDSVLNDSFSESYFLLIDHQTHVELGWFRRSQIKRRVFCFSRKLSPAT